MLAIVSTNTVFTIAVSWPITPDDYAPISIYQRVPYTRELLEAGDARRWMTGRFPPPVEVELASLPLPELDPPCELPRQPSRTIARSRGRRPMRGRSGRPHASEAAIR